MELDPDQFLLRPFVAYFTNDTRAVWHETDLKSKQFVLNKGRPFGQFYGVGAGWRSKAIEGTQTVVKAALNATF